MKQLLFFCAMSLFIFSCKREDSKYPYAIKDFSRTLQPHLKKIVSNGLVGVDYSEKWIEKNASDKELHEISICEHPLLRTVAIRALLNRPDINKNELILSHLNDTAFIVIEVSDWGASFTGIDFSSIADDMIKHSSWKSFSERQKIIDSVIMNHNYLDAAYTILDKIEPEEKYYKSIKEMIQRERDHGLLMNAIIALSRYRKKDDIGLITDIIKVYNEDLRFPSFVYEELRDTAFFNYFDAYYNYIVERGLKYLTDTSKIIWDDFENKKSTTQDK